MAPMPGGGGAQPPPGAGWQGGGFGGGGGGGWRQDPSGRFEERFFIAGQWTRRVRWGGCEAVDLQAWDDDGPAPTDWQQRPDEVDPDHCSWEQDPTGRFPERWWDGLGFTRKVRVGRAVATDTAGAPEDAGRGRGRGRAAAADTAGPGWLDDPDGPGQRFWDGYQWTAKTRAGPPPRGGYSRRGLGSPVMLLVVAGVAVVLLVVGLIVAMVVLVL